MPSQVLKALGSVVTEDFSNANIVNAQLWNVILATIFADTIEDFRPRISAMSTMEKYHTDRKVYR